MPAEFDCAECGVHVVQVVADQPPKIALCLQCIYLPGWFKDPTLRRMLDPTMENPPMRAELFAAPNGFVASFDCPPFNVPPPVMKWGGRTFKLAAGDATHLPNCNSITKQVLDKDQVAGCSCDRAYAYDEVSVWTLADMHQIEAVRAAPITRKAG